ncbi:MAG: ATP-binding protein [Candidatus Falkowbacteria bacterium]
MKTITVLSGKGGVGKSSLTASLAIAFSRRKKIIAADCDVDASNLALVFGVREKDYEEWKEISTNQRPVFDRDKCDSCRECFKNCYFGAICWKKKKPVLFNYGCEGCGVCELVCLRGAITLKDIVNARIGYAETRYGFKIALAQLEVGESGSGKVVAEVKRRAAELAGDAKIMLSDSAAGISCPVIASVTGSDYCVLVAEPTSSSLADMKKALAVVKHFEVPRGIIINKYDINEEGCRQIEEFAAGEEIKILGKLPYDRVFVEALVNMTPVIEKSEKLDRLFSLIADELIKIIF